jgi:transcriptional regulator with XRE-family HTH domain
MDETNDRDVGRLIAALRKERGWSQGWLASRAGMTQSVLSRIEASKREARATELARLAKALGVGPETLLEGLEEAEIRDQSAAPDAVRPALGSDAPAGVARANSPSADLVAFLASRDDADGLDAGALMEAPREFPLRLSDEYPAREDSAGEDAAPREHAREDHARGAWSASESRLDARTLKRLARLREESDRPAEEPARPAEMPGAPASERARETAFSPDRLRGAAFTVGPAGAEDQFLHIPATDLSALPPLVAEVIADYLRMRALATDEERPWQASWDTVDSLGRRRPAGKPSGFAAGRPAAAVSWNEPRDRYARLWRHELGIGVDGPVPDLVALFEDAGLAEVIVARLGTDEPVCANVTVLRAWDAGGGARRAVSGRDLTARAGADTVSFIFVNADRPVALQRHALVHAFAHLVLGHGDVVNRRIEWSRATPPEVEANDFAEEFLAPADAVARWYDRHGDPQPSVDVLLELAGAFGITYWAALYRSRAAGRLGPKPHARLSHELRARQWELLPEQSFRGGLRDTLSTLGEEAPLPPSGAEGVGGVKPRLTRSTAGSEPAVLRVPARLRLCTLQALRGGRLSLEQGAGILHRPPAALGAELERLGLE